MGSRRELRRAKRLIQQAKTLNYEMVDHVEAGQVSRPPWATSPGPVWSATSRWTGSVEHEVVIAKIARDKAEARLRTREFGWETESIDAISRDGQRRESGAERPDAGAQVRDEVTDVIAQKRGVLEALRRAGWADADPVVAVVREMFNQRLARMTD